MGRWLLESLAFANRERALDARAVVLTRRPGAFARAAPGLADGSSITLLEGDVRELGPGLGTFTHAIHAATPASALLNAADPQGMRDVIERGTRRVVEAVRRPVRTTPAPREFRGGVSPAGAAGRAPG